MTYLKVRVRPDVRFMCASCGGPPGRGRRVSVPIDKNKITNFRYCMTRASCAVCGKESGFWVKTSDDKGYLEFVCKVTAGRLNHTEAKWRETI